MARQKVLQLICDRCARVEVRPISDAKNTVDGPMFKAEFNGESVQFEDLCTGCESILKNHWDQIAKKLKKSSPKRDG